MKFIYYTILTLTIVSFASIIYLSTSHIVSENICPKIFSIPACFILTPFIFSVLVSHLNLVNDKNILFFVGAGITFLIAIIASLSQTNGWAECPKLFDKIPMCYLSFLTFGTIITLKVIEIKQYATRIR